ncbi:MAG: TetR/AcrR family transcriptional regulator [Cellvibrionaceae bacterium]|nr:TetR/AcrR family transcriptional regulator [Cellvibrionaceae bacterium]
MTQKTSRSEKTRARILAAAKDCYSEVGVAKSSMEMIAERASTTKPTLYAHFGSKEALFEVIALDLTEQIQSPEYRPFNKDLPVAEQLYDLLTIYLDGLLALNNELLIRAIMIEYAGRRQAYSIDFACVKQNVLLNWLSAANDSGAINVPDVEISSNLIMSMVEGLLIWPAVMEVEKHDEKERARLLRQVIDFSLRSMC